MAFLSIGHERLKTWLDEQRAKPTMKVELARQQLFCPHCARELGVRYGKYSEAFFVVHFECGGLCPLEFRTWWGKLKSEAIENFTEYRDTYEPIEIPPEDPGAESLPGPAAETDPREDLEYINAALTETVIEDDPYLR